MTTCSLIDIPLTLKYDLLYVGIGSARDPWHQYPPSVATWPGKKVCLLIDPLLESPPAICSQLGIYPDNSDTLTVDDTTFIFLRDYFYWSSTAHILSFIDYTIRRGAHMILQDYTGEPFRRHYPIELYERDSLLRHVLFDMSYRDEGCCVDVTKVHIYRDNNGDFVQPSYMPLTSAQAYLDLVALFNEARERYTAAIDYAHRMVRIELGYEPARHWCTYDSVFEKTHRLFYVYQLDTSIDMLQALVLATVLDIVAVTGDRISSREVLRMIKSSDPRELAKFCSAYINRLVISS